MTPEEIKEEMLSKAHFILNNPEKCELDYAVIYPNEHHEGCYVIYYSGRSRSGLSPLSQKGIARAFEHFRKFIKGPHYNGIPSWRATPLVDLAKNKQSYEELIKKPSNSRVEDNFRYFQNKFKEQMTPNQLVKLINEFTSFKV